MASSFLVRLSCADGQIPIKLDSGSAQASKNFNRLGILFDKLAKGAKLYPIVAQFVADASNAFATATGTVTAADVAGSDTVTINGVALTATQQYARGTVTCASVQANDTVTIDGVVFTAKAAENTASREFNRSGSDAACAASLLACINAHAATAAKVTGAVSSNVLTMRSIVVGTAGNAYTLVSSNARLAVSGSGTFTGGAAIANNQFDFGGTNAQTAASLVYCINNSTSALIANHVTASAAGAVVTLTANHPGHWGNAVTLASSNGTRLAVTGARLTGGAGCADDEVVI